MSRAACPVEAEARAAGYTLAVLASSDQHDLELLVKPDTDLDSAFPAFCRSEQEWLNVNGWLFSFESDPS